MQTRIKCPKVFMRRGSNLTPPAVPNNPNPVPVPPRIPAPGNRGIIDELFDIYRGAAKEIAAGQQSSRAEALRAMRAEYLPARHLVREEVIEFDEAPFYTDNGVAVELPGPLQRVTAWSFHYSDGDVEQVTSRRGAHATA